MGCTSSDLSVAEEAIHREQMGPQVAFVEVVNKEPRPVEGCVMLTKSKLDNCLPSEESESDFDEQYDHQEVQSLLHQIRLYRDDTSRTSASTCDMPRRKEADEPERSGKPVDAIAFVTSATTRPPATTGQTLGKKLLAQEEEVPDWLFTHQEEPEFASLQLADKIRHERAMRNPALVA